MKRLLSKFFKPRQPQPLVLPTVIENVVYRNVYRKGVGYGHDFSKLDELIPYEIVFLGKKENAPGTLNSQLLCVRDKITGKVIRNIEYNYSSYGTDAFAPFIWEGIWHAFIPKTYMKSEIINLETGETVAVSAKNDCSWCPVNYYVPCFYRDPEIRTFTRQNGEKKEYTLEYCDHEMRGLAEEGKAPDFKDFTYLNTALVAGVFWAADNEWLVYKLDLKEIMKTGIIPLPGKETYCFEFDYGAPPEIRQHMRIIGIHDGSIADHKRFEYYTQNFTDDAWVVKDNK